MPKFKVVASRRLNDKFEEDVAPVLVRGASGSILATSDRGYLKVTAAEVVLAEADGKAGALQADHHVCLPGIQTGSQSGWLDLSLYHGEGLLPYSAYGQGKLLLSRPLTQSGERALFKVAGASGDRLAAVDGASREITVFDIPPGRLNLTSDARYLVVQQYGEAGGEPYGKAWFLNLAEGAILKEYDDDRVRNSAFLAFAPTGQLVFRGFVLDTGLTFAETVPDNAFFARE